MLLLACTSLPGRFLLFTCSNSNEQVCMYIGLCCVRPRKRKREVLEEEDSDALDWESDEDDLNVMDNMDWELGDGGAKGAVAMALGVKILQVVVYIYM